MQNKPSDERLAKAAYNWLRLSPLLTIPTLYFSIMLIFAIGADVFYNCTPYNSQYCNTLNLIPSLVGIILSGLWHLILLQYVNNKDSEFVRKHGREALKFAGIRTATAFAAVGLDYLLGSNGVLSCMAAIILFALWLMQTKIGLENITKELEADPSISRDSIPQQINTTEQSRIYLTDENRDETLNQILSELQSNDDVTVLKTIEKLNSIQESNEAILKKLETLADEHDNIDIRMDARVVFNKIKRIKIISNKVISMEVNMAENESRSPVEILNEILENLKSKEDEQIIKAFAELKKINYSSEAILRQIEKILLSSSNSKVREEAREVLNLASNRAVQKSSNTLERGVRYTILNEIKKWMNDGLLTKETADVIQSRYNFDFIQKPDLDKLDVWQSTPEPTSSPQRVSVQPKVPQPIIQPSAPAKPAEPAAPRPSLLQTLTSEASVKIYLYLGAFFVIAAAAIFAAAIPELRLPLLIIGTFIFGGLAIVIKKRLPQPSFVLFIVFSFLFLITANSLEESLRVTFKYSDLFTESYWVAICLIMTVVWGGGTRLYESRFLSIVAFGSFVIALFRIGIVFETVPEFYSLMLAIAACSGLAGVWLLKKWKDANFALPLFLATQLIQAITLIVSISVFTINVFDPSNISLWHLIGFFVWALAGIYYILSDRLYPFPVFAWLTASVLIPMPWFIAAAFDIESLGSTILLFVWGAILAIASEALNKIETTHKYSLPMLIASMPALGLSLITSFAYENWLALITSFGIGVILTVLHILRTRWWLWSLALINFIIAYFVFFNLNFIQSLNIFIGYQLVGVSMLCLIPDLFLKKDWGAEPEQRLPLRIFGVVLSISTVAILVTQNASIHIAICFASLTFFSTIYSIAYQKSWLAYISTALLPIAIFYAIDYFNSTGWLASFTGLTFLYFIFGIAIRSKENWSLVLRNSALILGSIISFVALINSSQASGWYVFAIGLLFISEMVLRKNGAFEISAPILFSIAAFLLMQDFKVNNTSTQLLVHSIIWIFADLLAHLTFKHPRPLNIVIRGIGGFIAIITYGFLFGETASIAATGFAIYTLLFTIYAIAYQTSGLGYIPVATLPIAIVFTLNYFNKDAWLPALTILSILYFGFGIVLRAKEDWSLMLRNSALILSSIISVVALTTLKETGGWYVLVIGLLFIAEMVLRKNGWFELGAPILFSIGAFLILRDFDLDRISYQLLAYSLVWVFADLLAHLTFKHARPLNMIVRSIGGFIAIINYGFLFSETASIAATGFGVYTLLFLTVSLLYRQSTLFYAFTLTLPLFVTFLFRSFGFDKWIHPVIMIALVYYAIGFALRSLHRLKGWDLTLLYSGLGLGVFVSIAAPILGGVDASIPVAAAATLWAVEAFSKKNVWLAFPANGLYLLAYFILLNELKVSEPQFFSIGAALLGLIQHYLLTRAGSKTGAFIMGMISQFILVGTTYLQMLSEGELIYFFVLFLQSLAVLAYGIIIRSRSLTFFPIGFVVIGVMTVVLGQLQELGTILVIGCAGVLLLVLGIAAVLLRERITKLSEKLSDWQA